MIKMVAVGFNSALFDLSNDRNSPWLGSKFAFCFGQLFPDPKLLFQL